MCRAALARPSNGISPQHIDHGRRRLSAQPHDRRLHDCGIVGFLKLGDAGNIRRRAQDVSDLVVLRNRMQVCSRGSISGCLRSQPRILGWGVPRSMVGIHGSHALEIAPPRTLDELPRSLDSRSRPTITGPGTLERRQDLIRRLRDVGDDRAQLVIGQLEVTSHGINVTPVRRPIPPSACGDETALAEPERS